MKNIFFKLILLGATTAVAAQDDQMEIEEPIKESEVCVKSVEEAVDTTKTKLCVKPEIKCEIEQLACKDNFFLSGSFLYWEPVNSSSDSYTNDDFEPGFKVGAGKYFANNRWLIDGEYTWFHFNKSSNIDGYDLQYDFDFDVLDIDISRIFCIQSCLFLTPHLGSRTLWFDQSFFIPLFYEDEFSENRFLGNVNLDLDTLKTGVRAGVDTIWNFESEWYLSGKLSISGLYGNSIIQVSAGPEEKEYSGKDAWTPVFDSFIGFGYDSSCFNRNQISLNLSLGYEFMYFWNMYPKDETIGLSANDNFYIHGLTIAAQLIF